MAAKPTRLHYVERGSGSVVLVLYGFTGSAEMMEELSVLLGGSHRVINLDVAGHGSSAPTTGDYTMDDAVDDLDEVVSLIDPFSVHLVGYSMGGRIAPPYAVAHFAKVRSLVLIGASAGISDASERRRRRADDDELADRIEVFGIEWFVNHWAAQPLLRLVTRRDTAALDRWNQIRLSNDPRALSGVLRGLGTGRMPPPHDDLAALDVSVLLLVGDAGAKFLVIAGKMAATMGQARRIVIPDAGHAAYLDNPEKVARVSLEFFADVEGGRE